jgi:hypothetical protein
MDRMFRREWIVPLAIVFVINLMAGDRTAPPAQQLPPDGMAAAPAFRAMSTHHMEMGPHMRMTALRKPKPGDRERADAVVRAARAYLEKYRDYLSALQDGYQIFLPNVPQNVYHFTNYSYGFEELFQFKPERPGTLLYEKTPDGYRLVGAMYTAAPDATEKEMDERIPLSAGQWHAHVNFCFAPRNRNQALHDRHRFGFAGSISTRDECAKAGGRFVPQFFGWMVHVYPFERNPKDIWAVDPPNSVGMPHSH